MRTLIQLLLFAFLVSPAQAQLPTTDLDRFNRSDSIELGPTPTEPTSVTWTEQGEEVDDAATSLTADSTVRLEDSAAVLQSGATNSQKWATLDMSNVSGYPTTLDDAGGTVTWAFNMRQNRDNPEGFSPGEHGLMFVLASSGSDVPGSGNAYAVVLGQDGTDNLKLVSFNGGFSDEGEFQDIAAWSTDLSTGFVSVRVTFDSDTKEWTLFAESGTSGYPYSDPRNVTAERGSAQNSDLTGDGQKHMGILWNHGQDDSATAFFDDIYVTDPGRNLPVEFASFNVTADGGAARLRWETATETQNAGFEVQRATEHGFESLDFVEGAGTTTESTQYTYTTEGLTPGRHTFRLKQVDLDGSTSVGPERVLTLRPDGLQIATTGPNPIRKGQRARFRLAADTGQVVTVTLHDVLGRTVRTLYDGQVGPQGRDLSVSTSSLSTGMYFVRIEGASGTTTRRITVRR